MEEKYYSWAILYKDGKLEHVVDVEKNEENKVTKVGVATETFGLLFPLSTAKMVQKHWDNVSDDGILVTVPDSTTYKDWQSYVGEEVGKKEFKVMEKYGGLTVETLDKIASEEHQKEISSGTPQLVTHEQKNGLDVKLSEFTTPIEEIKTRVAKSTKLPTFNVDGVDNQRYVFISKRDSRLSLQLMSANVEDFEYITLVDYSDIDESERFTIEEVKNVGYNPEDFWAIPTRDNQKLTVKDLIEYSE